MSKSKIDWTDETINPFTGCNGPNGKRCSYCYAEKMAKRLAAMPGGKKYRLIAKHNNGDPFAPTFNSSVLCDEADRLGRSRKPRRVFIGSMGEMCFGGSCCFFALLGKADGGINTEIVQKKIAKFCTALSRHTFQILTKRPDLLSVDVKWPSNVHLGVSITNKYDVDRVQKLLLYLAKWRLAHPTLDRFKCWASIEPLHGEMDTEKLIGLDWVVIGAKTGGRRGVARSIIRAAQEIDAWCALNDVPCFVKDNMRGADPDFDWPREFPK